MAAPPKPPSAPPANNRIQDRHDRKLRVFFTYDGVEKDGISKNISLGGMYVVTPDPPPFGVSVMLRFKLPTYKEESRVKASVRWVDAEGMGVQFGTLRAIEVWALNQYFKQED